MNTDRRTRMGDILQEAAATFIRNEANSNPLITVTSVDLTPDCKHAIIFITTIPDGRENDAVVFLKRHASELRRFIRQKTKVGNVPHLEFMVDAGEKHRQHIDEIARKIEEEKK